jgi:CheY-like chemotaxis protein
MPLSGAILVADDDPGVRANLREVLDAAGYPVLTASNGEEALHVMRSPLPVAAVVLDVMMPVKNGLEVLDEKNGDPRLRDIPVLLLTAVTYDLVAEIHGVRRVFPKPLQLVSLLEELEHLDAAA